MNGVEHEEKEQVIHQLTMNVGAHEHPHMEHQRRPDIIQ